MGGCQSRETEQLLPWSFIKFTNKKVVILKFWFVLSARARARARPGLPELGGLASRTFKKDKQNTFSRARALKFGVLSRARVAHVMSCSDFNERFTLWIERSLLSKNYVPIIKSPLTHIVQCMCAASARHPRVQPALFAPKLRSFSIENRAIFALKFLKISTIAATDARRTRTTHSNNHLMHASQVPQVCLSSAVLCAPKSAQKLHDFRLKSRKFR